MAKAKKFGAFGGVFTPSILTILGVILYMRLPWIVGQAGFWGTLGIIIVAHIISITTGLSVASIATDKRVKTGGPYFIISRSLGLPIGGTLGWALFVGLSFSVSLYLIGFSEAFLGYFGFDVNIFNIRVAGSAILLTATILALISTSLTIKTQYLIMAAIALSLVSVFLGTHTYTPVQPQWYGAPDSLPWITLFAIFFPAVTGFTTGVAMSGDLKDSRKNIPVGIMTAIGAGLLIYIGLALFLALTVSREMLVNDLNVLFQISYVPQLIIAGILGATLSSALGCILGAPRILQAVARDRIAAGFWGKGYGASSEPRNALILTFIIAQAGILIGELNVIARIVSIFFIIIYGFLNLTYTVESWASSDFMPSFKIPRVVSIIGVLASVIVMIQLDTAALAIASLALIGLFFYIKKKEINLQSGDTRSSIWLSIVKTGLLKLAKVKTESRNWRPNVILFSGGVVNRPHLIEIGHAIVGKLGIFTNFELIEHPDEPLRYEKKELVTAEPKPGYTDIITRKHVCRNIYEGIEMISRVYGFSGFEPNTILMGWARNTRDPKRFTELLGSLNKLNYNLTFLNYDGEHGFGNYKRIDLWWSGYGRNLALGLHLIRFITATTQWRRAEVRIMAINTESSVNEHYYAILKHMIENYRINAAIKVITNVEKLSEAEIMRSESQEADLTIAELPGFQPGRTEGVVEAGNRITKSLRTSLLIHAATIFEEVNVISGTSLSAKTDPDSEQADRPVRSILENIRLSKNELVFNEVYHLAELLETNIRTLNDNTIMAVARGRNSLLQPLKGQIEALHGKLVKTGKIQYEKEQRREYLKILNDFAFGALKQIEAFKADHLKAEKELIRNGFSNFISETDRSLASLPQQIRLLFGKDDYRNVQTKGIFRKIRKTGMMIWLSLFRKKIAHRVFVQSAARYFFGLKRMDYYTRYMGEFPEQAVVSFSEYREIITRSIEMIEKARADNVTDTEIASEKSAILALLAGSMSNNRQHAGREGNQMMDHLREDLEYFGGTIDNPLARYNYKRFKSGYKKGSGKWDALEEFPDLFARFMESYVNKTFLDYLFLTLKYRLSSKIEKALRDFTLALGVNMLKRLKALELRVKSFDENGKDVNVPEDGFIGDSVVLSRIEEVFSNLEKEISQAVETLPEKIEISENISGKDNMPGAFETLPSVQIAVRKTADFYITNELSDQIRKQSVYLNQQLLRSSSTLKDITRLTNFNIEYEKSANDYDGETGNKQDQKRDFVGMALQSVRGEVQKLNEMPAILLKELSGALKRAFEPLSSAVIAGSSSDLTKKKKVAEKRKFLQRLRRIKEKVGRIALHQWVKALYGKSEGLLWARRLEQSQERALLFPGEPVKKMLARVTPDRSLLQKLPFYYVNLFSGKPNPGEGIWVGMEDEVENGSNAIRRFLRGAAGMIIITGERSSGKSSLSLKIAGLHFAKQNIYNVKAPKESAADMALFEQTLLVVLGGQNSMAYSMDVLPPKSVIIIHDLELWWQRKPSGSQVVSKIISLMKQYSHKALFIVNVNKYALKIIDQITGITSWAIDLIFCQPFDARELKELVLSRHRAGGLKFILNTRHESDMTDLEYARLFNRLFNISLGNPGYALHLWLASIKKVAGDTLYIEKLSDKGISFNELSDPVETLCLLQFVMHRRFSVKSLSGILKNDPESTERVVRNLLQKGILVEKFTGIYAMNPALEIHVVKKLKSLELI